jgi:DNA-directed RNA polymerase alpha subunit
MERVNTVFHETVKLFNKLDKAETEAENNKQPIEVLNLPVRAENALINNNVKYVEDLRNIDIYDLELMRGLGKVAVEHIVRALKNVK